MYLPSKFSDYGVHNYWIGYIAFNAVNFLERPWMQRLVFWKQLDQ